MANISVTLTTTHHEGRMHQPGVGTTRLGIEVVTGLQLPDSAPQFFAHHLLPGEGSDIDQVVLPEDMALRLAHFTQDHFVEGAGGFDCHSFLGFIMG